MACRCGEMRCLGKHRAHSESGKARFHRRHAARIGRRRIAHLKKFVQEGGLLITSEDTAEFAIEEGMAPGVFVAPRKTLKVVGSVLNSAVVDTQTPCAYGYKEHRAFV